MDEKIIINADNLSDDLSKVEESLGETTFDFIDWKAYDSLSEEEKKNVDARMIEGDDNNAPLFRILEDEDIYAEGVIVTNKSDDDLTEQEIEDEYEIVETTMGNLQEGDLLMGSDGKWHQIEILPEQEKRLYSVQTSAGAVRCSWDHYWVIYKDGIRWELSTIELFGGLKKFLGGAIGREDSGVTLRGVRVEDVDYCRCVAVVGDGDHQFEVLTKDGNPVLTRNCQTRLVCGQLGPVASQMALSSSLATTIDGKHKGAGLVAVNGIISNCQYYFAPASWIDEWMADHGCDKYGYPIGKSKEEINPDDIYLGDDDEELSLSQDDKHFEFEGLEKDVLNRKDQKFENI